MLPLVAHVVHWISSRYEEASDHAFHVPADCPSADGSICASRDHLFYRLLAWFYEVVLSHTFPDFRLVPQWFFLGGFFSLTFSRGFLLGWFPGTGRVGGVFLARVAALWTRDARNVRQVRRRRLGQRRVAALQQEVPVVDDARA